MFIPFLLQRNRLLLRCRLNPYAFNLFLIFDQTRTAQPQPQPFTLPLQPTLDSLSIRTLAIKHHRHACTESIMSSAAEDQSASTPPTIKGTMKKIKASPITHFFICLAWLHFSLILIGAGFQGLSAEIKLKYALEATRLAAFRGNHAQELFVQRQLESLLEFQLEPNHLFETHRDCLARAANIADAHYLGGHYYEFPEVLNQTVEWAQDNCDRLSFTAAIRHDRSGLFGKAVASFSGKAVRMYHRVKIIGMNAWDRFFQLRVKLHNTEKRVDARSPSKKATTSSAKDHFVLPSRIKIDCSGIICHLSGNSSSMGVFITEAEIRNARESMFKYGHVLAMVAMAQRVVEVAEHLTFTALWMPYSFLVYFLIILTFTKHSPRTTIPKIWARLHELRKEHSSAPLPHRYRLTILLAFSGARKTCYNIPQCLIEPCLLLGITLIMVFFFHSRANPPASLEKLLQTMQELRQIWRLDAPVPTSPNTKPNTTIEMEESPANSSTSPTTGTKTDGKRSRSTASKNAKLDTIMETEEHAVGSSPSSKTATTTDAKLSRSTILHMATIEEELEEMVELHGSSA
ncbi:hypothetical protein DM02DRAFT_110268 [Periconia macrospinosa]|uniref:Uncharacterized protein n=1 Tax=Periconia macrospinosa TaxID=97972 RepID=A0A2V1E3V0_9PLEO|nr:hypothetical protein DM02DRAFT_110268 [Periconia macrospinosa]